MGYDQCHGLCVRIDGCPFEKKNAYAEIFSPQRHIKKSFGDFTSNAMTNAKGIILGYFGVSFKTAADVPAGSGMIVFYNGKRRAVYRDLEGNLHVIGCMCPHHALRIGLERQYEYVGLPLSRLPFRHLRQYPFRACGESL